jgi:hypothetical protein
LLGQFGADKFGVAKFGAGNRVRPNWVWVQLGVAKLGVDANSVRVQIRCSSDSYFLHIAGLLIASKPQVIINIMENL